MTTDQEPEVLDLTDAIPAAQAEIEPEHPQATPGIGGTPPQQELSQAQDSVAAAPTPTTPAAESPRLDKKGRPFDPAKHAPGPDGRGELTTRGTWKVKGERGRPYRKREGATEDPPPAAAGPQEEAPAEPPPAASWIGKPPADAAPALDAINLGTGPDEVTLDDYKATAEAVARAQFGVAQIFVGRAWETAPAEHRQWADAWQAALYEWRAPRVGAAASLVVLAVTSWAKRRDDPETKSAGRRLVDWFRRLIGKPAIVRELEDRPKTEPAAPQAAAPNPGAWTPGTTTPSASTTSKFS